MFLRSCILLLAAATLAPAITIFSEDFNDVAALPGAGWVIKNNSAPVGSTSWFQGNAFPAHAGAANSYVGANFNAAGSGGTISLWLITPQVTIDNNSALSFFTRTADPTIAADRLQVRFSLAGTDVGSTENSVGDFFTLGIDINPSLDLVSYPRSWTQVVLSFAGLPGPTPVHIAFRYFVTDSGPNGNNGDYIGIDSLVIDNGVANSVPEPSTFLTMAAPLAFAFYLRRRRA
ncbi:MAG: choice-of-anchor J domain-containing protein [Bryobacterales bacterium]|nr:choice-of-anchor J domain-containing protein [Bryobacterales bacterium]